MATDSDTDELFAQLMDHVDVPMVVVTTAAGGERSGCLVGFSMEASIDPRRYLVGLSRKNHTTRVAADATHLAVHLLPWDRLDLARLFGEQTGDEVDKFAQCRWTAGPEDLPILDDALAWFTARIVDRVDLGDHIGHLVEPRDVQLPSSPAAHITYTDVKDLDPGHDA